MKRTFTMLVALITAIVAVLGFVAAWKVFDFTHFFVTDAVGDAREMRGDGAQPEYWRDFVGYLLFYIPGLLIALVSGTFAAVAANLLKRGVSTPQLLTHPAEHVVGGNGG
jgi:hypothetical protein